MRTFLITLWAVVLMATSATAQDSYRIRAGDTLAIEVLEDPALNRQVLVLPDGRFSFPFAGVVQAGGRTIPQVQSAIAEGIASNFAVPPNVFVSVAGLRPREPARAGSGVPAAPDTINVYFLGEVNSPGLREVEKGTTFLQAMSQSGGASRFAAQKRVQLRRTDPRTHAQTVYKINLRAIMDGARMNQDIQLQDGDVIVVPERRLFE